MVKYDLAGPAGNAFAVVAFVGDVLNQLGVKGSKAAAVALLESGSYKALLDNAKELLSRYFIEVEFYNSDEEDY